MSKTNSTANMLLCILGQTLLAMPAQSQDQSQDVEIIWTRHYAQETTRSRDVPKAMLVDRSGNLYVLGYVTNLIYGHSLLLLKFDQSGKEMWRAEYTDGPGEETEPMAMGMDEAENIYSSRPWHSARLDHRNRFDQVRRFGQSDSIFTLRGHIIFYKCRSFGSCS